MYIKHIYIKISINKITPVEYAGGERSLRVYIVMCLHIHCNPSVLSLVLQLNIAVDC